MHPPRLFLRFFRWYCHPKLRDYIEGDLMELYYERYDARSSKRYADIQFIIDVLLLFRPGIIRPAEKYTHINHYGMLKNYFRIGWRNIVRNKGYSFINIGGLAIGMMVAILIGLWISDEVSFDSYFKNHSKLSQVMLLQTGKGETYTGGTIAPVIVDPLRTKYGNDFKALSLVSWNDERIVSVKDIKLAEPGRWVEHAFPEMFTLDMLSGRRDALKDASTMLLSKSLAKALFGDEDALNKTVRIDNHFDMTVGGVYEDLPANTTFAGTKFLLSWNNRQNWVNSITEWDNHSCQLFAQLEEHADIDQVNRKIRNIPTPYVSEVKEELLLHPVDRLHLYSEFENGEVSGGLIQFVWLFGIIGIFVLLLACINFMNLSTARSEKRAKEVGIRKTIGSLRKQIIGQFLTESVVVALAALCIALVLVQAALPFFNTLAGKRMSVPWSSPVFWLLLTGFTLFSGIISGSYPAFYLSSFKPAKVLKGTFRAGRLASLPRKVLVVVQFTVSITLVISTIIVFQQIQFAKDRPVGYSRHGLISSNINTPELYNHYEALRTDLMQTGVLENMTRASQSPAKFANNTSIDWPGKNELTPFFRNVSITPEFGVTVGWTVKEGRDFSNEMASDSSAVLLNETAARIIAFKEPIGKTVKHGEKEYTIVGIVNDMVTQSPYDPIEPTIFFTRGWLGVITMRIKPDAPMREALTKIESIFRKHNPSAPFVFRFVDDEYEYKFAEEERIGNLASFFSILAIFISSMGLFGLASFVTEQRTKEIGIRKTMGASVASLWQLLSKDFIILVIVSCAIAIPLSVSFMQQWLQHYNYRTALPWYIFVLTITGAFIIALVTVSFQSIKAAVASPVKSLRSE
ncbi:MAG TPA: ABC transporter permease [Ohtaekwangia sp.]|uniref:ABC transporter permease n=1 Tax=Ohtaekwangia sp. TaxID=2066019 RepID=UPI002F95CC9F